MLSPASAPPITACQWLLSHHPLPPPCASPRFSPIRPCRDLYIFGLYDAAVSGTNAVIAGDTFTQYSTDSAGHFNTSSGGAGGGAAYNYGPNFALVGEFGSSNTPGVAISTDGECVSASGGVSAAGCVARTPSRWEAFLVAPP